MLLLLLLLQQLLPLHLFHYLLGGAYRAIWSEAGPANIRILLHRYGLLGRRRRLFLDFTVVGNIIVRVAVLRRRAAAHRR